MGHDRCCGRELGHQSAVSVLDYKREDPADRLSKQLGAQMQTLAEAQDQRTDRLIEAFQTLLSKQSVEDRNAFVEAEEGNRTFER